MPQPIEEGMVLGGRYLVTGHVLTSADQDMVLDGRDQVLNRDVSILVASAEHASQVAASARELATGERQGSIQVLDLGLSEGRTYLIAGGKPAPDELLDMTREQQVYVEPFQTDTLGSEIFGEARTYEPHVYEDDEEYYEDLDDTFTVESTEQRRPRFLKGLSERLSQRFGSHDAAREAVSGAAAGAVAGGRKEHDDDRSAGDAEAGPDPYRSAVRRTQEKPLPDTVSDDEWTGTHDEVAVDPERRYPVAGPRSADERTPGAEVTAAEDTGAENPDAGDSGEPVSHPTDGPADRDATTRGDHDPARGSTLDADTDTGKVRGDDVDTAEVRRADVDTAEARRGDVAHDRPVEPAGTSPRPKVSIWSDDQDEDLDVDRPARQQHGSGSAAAAAAVAGGAASASPEVSRQPSAVEATSPGRPDRGVDEGSDDVAAPSGDGSGRGHGEYPDEHHDEDEDYQDEDKPRGARWILGGILALVLILGAVFAFNLLGNNREPVADEVDPTTSSPAEDTPTPTQTAESDLPVPAIAGATRLVPDSPQLSAETDNTLPNAIDGNPATAWQTYSFAQPAFGGYASSMALVIELEEPSAVTQVDITQNNGSGGSFSVLLNDAPELDGARQIAEGSFTGPQVSVPVSGEDGAPAEAQYVIVNFTELPQLSNATGNLPYGLRIAEVQVQ